MKIAFSTSNLLRKEKYKIITTVYENRGKLFVRKSASSPQALPHIKLIAQAQELLTGNSGSLKMVKVLHKKRNYIDYEYINLPSLSQLIEKAITSQRFDQALGLVKKGLSIIDDLPAKQLNPYGANQFSQIFDPTKTYSSKETENCISLGVMDIKYDNLLISKDDSYLIDYEWVYPFALPKEYLKLRAVFYLCFSLQLIIDTFCSPHFPCSKILSNVLIPEEWLNLLNLKDSDLVRFLSYENKFQNYVNLVTSGFTPQDIYKEKALVTERLVEKPLDSQNQSLGAYKDSKVFKIWQKYSKLKGKIF